MTTLPKDSLSLNELKDALEKQQDYINKANEYLTSIFSKTYTYGVVISFGKRTSIDEEQKVDYLPKTKKIDTVMVIHQGRPIECVYYKKLELKVGDTVKCLQSSEGIGIVEKSDPVSFGQTVVIKSIIDNEKAEVDVQSISRIVLRGLHSGSDSTLEKGCRVILDETGAIIMRNLGKEQSTHVFTSSTGVSWNDIGGLEDVKREMTESIENPIKYKDLYKAYGRKPTKGILLYGPPGNGKTMIGKAVATSVAELYKSEPGFIYIKGPEILNMYVGNSEERIRSIFASARDFKERTGSRAIIFIDEAESILSKRGSGKSSDVDKTIVPQFLTEMDGLDDSSAIVILTTNRPDMLDSAIIREGRIDKKIKVPRPDMNTVQTIFDINLKPVPCKMDKIEISKSATDMIFSSGLDLYELTLKSGNTMRFGMRHIINGAMVSAIVNDAISSAINKDVASNAIAPSGVSLDDVETSILKFFKQNSQMNHEHHFEDLSYELTTEKNDKIESAKPLKIREHVRVKQEI